MSAALSVPLDQFDYVIVGAGSAGCVLANRLSADPAITVCLVEAGGCGQLHLDPHSGRLLLHVRQSAHRLALSHRARSRDLNGRSIKYPRGRVLGGTSSINGMVYIRGQARDYDGWRQQGNVGWSWNDVLPYFKKSEDQARGATRPMALAANCASRICAPPGRCSTRSATRRSNAAFHEPPTSTAATTKASAISR